MDGILRGLVVIRVVEALGDYHEQVPARLAWDQAFNILFFLYRPYHIDFCIPPGQYPHQMAVGSSIDHTLPEDVVVIVGGGPVGLTLAHVLSTHNIKSVLFERNPTTTTWPKMDLTNARSMELFRRIGIADGLRRQGVDPQIDQDVIISTGLTQDRILSKWELPSVNKFRRQILENNDGSQPQEPWQRISQEIFEKWLKAICDEDKLVDVRFGWRVLAVQEASDHVKTTVLSPQGEEINFVSRYLAGCDGGSSRVRRSLNIPIEGGPM